MKYYIKIGDKSMKKLLPLCIVGILVFSVLGVVAITNDKTNDLKIKSESIAISEPIIKDEGQYVTVSLEEAASSLLDPGKPMLPVLTKVFTFPFGTKISDVDVSFSETDELALLKEVNPATEPTPVDAKVVNEPIKDPAVYESAELYPARSYSYTAGAGLDGKEHVIYLAVQCYPVRYSPTNNILYMSDHAEIHVTYEEPAAPIIFSDQYDLVIISPSEFSNELQPLIDHKISMGVNTTLKTTEEIYSEYSGFDNAEKIKYFIKDAVETLGIDYVLLIGSINKLPIRTTWFYERHHEHIWNETIITDMYYADIYDVNSDFCSWDSNGNGLYGEVYEGFPGTNDTIDFYPDVNVGRLPCEKNAEVKTVVNKIIHYETETYGQSWFKNIILVGGDTFPGEGGNEGEEQNQITEQIMSDFTPIQLWTSDGTFNARLLNKAINNGAGFIDYSGHGFEIGVATHPPNSDTWVPYHTNHLLGAINGYKLPIIFFDACLTAKLDFNISEFVGYGSVNLQLFVNKFSTIASRLFPTFAWCMVKKSDGGAIATIGATRTAFGGLDSGCGYFAIHFWQAYSTGEKVSQMFSKAQNDYITNIPFDRFTVLEFVLIGDPSLQIGGY
jgi:Peptidase family C25/Propeptide_C25